MRQLKYLFAALLLAAPAVWADEPVEECAGLSYDRSGRRCPRRQHAGEPYHAAGQRKKANTTCHSDWSSARDTHLAI